MSVLDLRTVADDWQEAIEEFELDREFSLADVEPDPRFPRLSLAYRQRIVELAYESVTLDPSVDASELCGELGIDPDPASLRHWGDNYEPTLIPENDFEEYTQELAEDIGAIDSNAGWPAQHIDWEAAANALRVDYTTVRWNGDDYLIRSC